MRKYLIFLILRFFSENNIYKYININVFVPCLCKFDFRDTCLEECEPIEGRQVDVEEEKGKRIIL
jgi:hypothetical protein